MLSFGHPRTERFRCKILSKLKKFMIELDAHTPKDVIASYKAFRLMIRIGGRLVPVAAIAEDNAVKWLEEAPGVMEVREAIEAFVADME